MSQILYVCRVMLVDFGAVVRNKRKWAIKGQRYRHTQLAQTTRKDFPIFGESVQYGSIRQRDVEWSLIILSILPINIRRPGA